MAAEARVVHRRAASSDVAKYRFPSCHDIAHDKIMSLREPWPPVANPGAIKKSCTSGLFWGLLSHNIALSIFGRTTLAIHRYSRFRR